MIMICESYYNEFIKRFNQNNAKIGIKIKHMKCVKRICMILASSLNLNEMDIQIAQIIGLLHDLGRFYQIEKYNTFDDKKSIDHAEASNKLLFQDGYIKKFVPSTRSYDDIIEKAIYNHNKFNISCDVNKKEDIFCKIIRDADKIDIYRVMAMYNFDEVFLEDNSEIDIISDEVKDDFYSNSLVRNYLRKSFVDDFVSKLAYIFDFNFDKSKELLKEYGYFKLFFDKFIANTTLNNSDTLNELTHMYTYANNFLTL